MKSSTAHSYRMFPPATGTMTARRNLLSHLMVVAHQYLHKVELGPEANETDELGRIYFQTLVHLGGILDPDEPLVGFGSPGNAKLSLARLQALWTEIVTGDADPARAEEACRFAHGLLSRFPRATAFYVHECAQSFVEPEFAMDLLAQTSRFISNPAEGVLIAKAQAFALQVLLKHKNLPVSAPPVASDPPAAAARPQPAETTVKSETPTMIVTAGHKAALERITEMGELFFERPANTTHLALRCAVLIVGPTGAGKTFLAKQAARQLRAEYFRVTRGDWIPQGARAKTRPTTFQILDCLLASERLAIHCDEIEKMDIDFAQEWSAGIGSDLWNTLEGIFPVREYLADTKFGDRPVPTVEEVERKIRTRMWVIGSGAWQKVFEQQGRKVSFQANRDGDAGGVTAVDIRKAALISPEILLRFNSDIVTLPYPGRQETTALLESTGITALAAELGIVIADGDVDWNQGGMRILETIATRLALEKHRRAKRNGVSPRL
jgi:hypothetical protein